MSKSVSNLENGIKKEIRIKTLEDLLNLNLNTLEEVVNGQIDNRKAALIFTGSRTVTSSLKVGLEAMKLGLVKVAGMPVGNTAQLIEKSK